MDHEQRIPEPQAKVNNGWAQNVINYFSQNNSKICDTHSFHSHFAQYSLLSIVQRLDDVPKMIEIKLKAEIIYKTSLTSYFGEMRPLNFRHFLARKAAVIIENLIRLFFL